MEITGLNFLRKIRETKEEGYWIVERIVHLGERIEREYMLVSLLELERLLFKVNSVEELTVKDLELIQRVEIGRNLYISPNYPPFQEGVSFRDMDNGFIIRNEHNTKIDYLDLVRHLKELKLEWLHEYEKAVEDYIAKQKEVKLMEEER